MLRRCRRAAPVRSIVGLLGILAAVCVLPDSSKSQETLEIAGAARHESSWTIVEAEDETCRIEGKTSVFVYPRSVKRECVALFEGSRLSVSTTARAIYLRLPTVFMAPGPRYADVAGMRLRVRIDDRPWQEIALATARQEWPIAEHLPPGEHVVVVEPIGAMAMIDGFRFAPQPLSGLHGRIIASGYSELLTDVRADVFSGAERIRSEYVRSPFTGDFELWGLEPGSYRLRMTASGWLPQELPEVVIRRQGEKLDLGIIAIQRDPRCGGNDAQYGVGPRFGRSVSVAPGESFTTLINLPDGTPPAARLVSPFKAIDLGVSDVRELEFGSANDVGVATFHVAESTPYDMYDLRLSYATQAGDLTNVQAQAVCVREPLPGEFHLAGIGHMNTWGQETAEYLERVAGVAELAGARMLLVSNEVNAAYVSGAFQSLRIPYLVTKGNHTMPRWDEFFGASSLVHDDGSLRVVTHGQWPHESWHEANQLLRERSGAENRVLLCYEGYAPIDLIRDGQVDLLFDGHSDAEHADRQSFPPGTLHLRAPTQETIRWLPMTREGFSPEVQGADDVPVLNVPRDGQAPLRVRFSAANDGGSQEQTAILTNEYAIRFPCARIRFIMRAGRFRLEGGRLLQAFESDQGTTTILDAEVGVEAQAEVAVAVVPD